MHVWNHIKEALWNITVIVIIMTVVNMIRIMIIIIFMGTVEDIISANLMDVNDSRNVVTDYGDNYHTGSGFWMMDKESGG